ncbi:MAG: N-acetylmuramoyl-L-alanine amidase [Thermodesulfobacteriota bacterium]
MKQLLILLALTFFIPLGHPSLLSAANGVKSVEQESSPEKRYEQAKYYYKQLESAPLGESRENWLKGVRSFRKLYLSHPKSEFAAASLFMLGRMYFQMYIRFQTVIDLDESLSYYRDVANLFPEDRLADDALYKVGRILQTEKNSPEKAATVFKRIMTSYPDGDFHPKAADSLKILSQENNIPLPNVMTRQSQLNTLTTVLPVKYWSSKDYTRVVIKASGPVTYKERLLEKMGGKPRRLYIDFNSSYIEPRFRSPIPIEDGLLKRIRTGQFSPDTVRVVLDIQSISDFKIFSLPDPFRVVVDVRGQSTGQAAAASKPPKQVSAAPRTGDEVSAPAITSSETVETRIEQPEQADINGTVVILRAGKKNPVLSGKKGSGQTKEKMGTGGPALSLAQQLGLGVNRIVIDPGHGGKDPGATANGLKEKNIVLKVAQRLAPILKKRLNCDVMLTRTNDRFLALEERTAIANANSADLFVSLHVNAHPSKNVHGMETYFLNLSTNAEAMRVAAMENATSTHQMSDLQDILSDIMKNSKINESSRLAQHVHNALYGGLKRSDFNKIKSLGVKQAPFYVLIGAQMPAILIEIGFISNPNEADYMQNDKFLEQVAAGIERGITAYIHSTTASL